MKETAIPPTRTTLKELFRQKGIVQPDVQEYLAKISELEKENHDLRKKNKALDAELNRVREQIPEPEKAEFSPEILLHEAVLALKQERVQEAMKFLRAVLILEPENIKAMNNLAVVYSEMGYEHVAVEILKQILALEPDNSTALKNLAILQQSS